MAFAGLLGVPLGSTLAQLIRHKHPNADPLVCGTTLILSVPVMYFGFLVARYSTEWCYGLTFLAGNYKVVFSTVNSTSVLCATLLFSLKARPCALI